MCSIGEDDFGDDGGLHALIPATTSEPIENPHGICNKCGTENVLLFKLNCRDCFLAHTRHKFRATLGSSKILPRNANVLLIFDGRPESLVLLDMVHYAQSQNMFKRLHCNVKVLYIDDSVLSIEEHKAIESVERIKNIGNFLMGYKPLESFTVSLSNGHIRNIEEGNVTLSPDLTLEKKFVEKINSIKTLTSRQDYVKHHWSQVIVNAAKELNCDFVFVPDASSTLAVKLLSAIALGRGGSAALDVSLIDDRYSDQVKIVRPLKDLTDMDIELYLNARNLESVEQSKCYGMAEDATKSLQNMTSAFVSNLQKNYPSSVSIVFRTGSKITANRDMIPNGKTIDDISMEDNLNVMNMCSNCSSPLDTLNSATLGAIKFSHVVSDIGIGFDQDTDIANLTKRMHLQGNDADKLCRGCQNIFDDCDNINSNLL